MRTILTFLLLASCTSPATKRLQADVYELRERIERLESTIRTLEGAVGLPGDPEREAAAMEFAVPIREALDRYDMLAARDLAETLIERYPDTQLGRAAIDLVEQLELIGSPAGELQVADWIQGEAHLDDDRLIMLVFMEAWCAYCRQEVPELQGRLDALHDDGLDIIGLTSLSRDTSREDFQAFLDASGAKFPVGLDEGPLAIRYRVEGVPYAVLLKDGKVHWTGSPGQMTTEVLQGMLPGT
ncbi:MAG: TlpA family protein disulfide reductase [Deltaproteobacteria bacterium]|nr:MAG: TlpA family protein disulfide reductase [Deltaproteobacteria bacterium]